MTPVIDHEYATQSDSVLLDDTTSNILYLPAILNELETPTDVMTLRVAPLTLTLLTDLEIALHRRLLRRHRRRALNLIL